MQYAVAALLVDARNRHCVLINAREHLVRSSLSPRACSLSMRTLVVSLTLISFAVSTGAASLPLAVMAFADDACSYGGSLGVSASGQCTYTTLLDAYYKIGSDGSCVFHSLCQP